MYFEVEHVFDAPIDVVEKAMFDPSYPAFLLEHHEVLAGVAPQSTEDDGKLLKRRIRYAPLPAIEQIAHKKVPPHWFEFIEESVWDRSARRLRFEHHPLEDKVRRRLTTTGEIALEPLPSGKTRRLTRTQIKVSNLPFLLKPLAPTAEQMLGREAKRMYDSEARVFGEFLRAREPQASAATR